MVFSFPSGHAMVAYGALLVAALPLLRGRARTWATAVTVALVGAVGASRVVLGVHYPTDVAAGWLYGLTWLVVAAAAMR